MAVMQLSIIFTAGTRFIKIELDRALGRATKELFKCRQVLKSYGRQRPRSMSSRIAFAIAVLNDQSDH